MSLTLDHLRAAYDLIQSGPMGSLKLSTVAVRIGPARVHAQRRNGGKRSYHRRVQKKWIRRWGMADRTPIKRGEVYKIRDPFTGRESLVVREDDMPRIRAAFLEDAP